jgi:hypothetical protein
VVGCAAAGAALPLARTGPAAAQLAPPVFDAETRAAPGLRFSRFAVDTRALLATSNDATARLVAQDLQRSLADVFADRAAGRGGGATLLVRIDSIFLPPYTGGGSGSGKGNGPDNMSGTGIVVSGGRALSETPLLATLDSSYSGAWYQPNIDALRVASLSHQFAYWLRREMGL